jgi:hypothetical protein
MSTTRRPARFANNGRSSDIELNTKGPESSEASRALGRQNVESVTGRLSTHLNGSREGSGALQQQPQEIAIDMDIISSTPLWPSGQALPACDTASWPPTNARHGSSVPTRMPMRGPQRIGPTARRRPPHTAGFPVRSSSFSASEMPIAIVRLPGPRQSEASGQICRVTQPASPHRAGPPAAHRADASSGCNAPNQHSRRRCSASVTTLTSE